MAAGPDPTQGARSTTPNPAAGPAEPAAVRSLLRWLPRSHAPSALAGRYDRVHIPGPHRHDRVALWWAPDVVHPGCAVGAPRGGVAPGNEPDYDVALTGGGYLLVRGGSVQEWAATAAAEAVVRADGQDFHAADYGPQRPYFRSQYLAMTTDDARVALASSQDCDPSDATVASVLHQVRHHQQPAVCGCDGLLTSADEPAQTQGASLPPQLLSDAPMLRVIAGDADADASVATLWRLSEQVAEPSAVGRAMAAESVGRGWGESAADWPAAPITEATVAQVASQAVRWHGRDVVRRMPAWLLGWVMVADSVLESLEPRRTAVNDGLDTADRVRLSRVERQWLAMASARRWLARAHESLSHLDGRDIPAVLDSEEMYVDLSSTRSPVEEPEDKNGWGGRPLRDYAQRAYQCDVRSWFGLFSGTPR